VASIARHAEQVGLDCIWAEDRLVAGEMCVLDCVLTLACPKSSAFDCGH
jgi:alkanesulfonate monooxygenase SsuD/methylene tetrahydromethanopterin reductase-like flavin-dependent oxidoreductase (luciferase family)